MAAAFPVVKGSYHELTELFLSVAFPLRVGTLHTVRLETGKCVSEAKLSQFISIEPVSKLSEQRTQTLLAQLLSDGSISSRGLCSQVSEVKCNKTEEMKLCRGFYTQRGRLDFLCLQQPHRP